MVAQRVSDSTRNFNFIFRILQYKEVPISAITINTPLFYDSMEERNNMLSLNIITNPVKLIQSVVFH